MVVVVVAAVSWIVSVVVEESRSVMVTVDGSGAVVVIDAVSSDAW